jgi:hypothetical protein
MTGEQLAGTEAYDLLVVCETFKDGHEIVIYDRHGKQVTSGHGGSSKASRYVEMYRAVIMGLTMAEELSPAPDHVSVAICVRNEMVTKQLTGEYKVSDVALKPLYDEFVALKRKFSFVWVNPHFDYEPVLAMKDAEQTQAVSEP